MAPVLDDVELARRAAAGDGGAFATLYDRHERRAYNLCYRITGSPDDAADATQETFLKVLERLPGLAGRELNFGSYLLTAARHASYDAIERRRRTAPAGEIPDSAVPVAAGAAPDAPDRSRCGAPIARTSAPPTPCCPRASARRSCCARSRSSPMTRSRSSWA